MSVDSERPATGSGQVPAPVGSRQPAMRREGAVAVGATALGTVAFGALVMGALAIGKLAIGQLAVGRASLRSGDVDELRIRRLIITELRIDRRQDW